MYILLLQGRRPSRPELHFVLSSFILYVVVVSFLVFFEVRRKWRLNWIYGPMKKEKKKKKKKKSQAISSIISRNKALAFGGWFVTFELTTFHTITGP